MASSPSAVKCRTALTLAAGAAAAVTARQAGAAVIYAPLDVQVNAANPSYDIDLNNDGLLDVGIKYDPTAGLALTSPTANKFTGYVGNGTAQTAKALAAGDAIDNSMAFNPLAGFTYSVPPVFYPLDATVNGGAGAGEFTAAAGERYFGVQFGTPDSGPRYGWVGFRVDDDSSMESLSGTVTGYGYEDTVGQPITAGAIPEPSSLGLLAMGATGLAAYRRRGR